MQPGALQFASSLTSGLEAAPDGLLGEGHQPDDDLTLDTSTIRVIDRLGELIEGSKIIYYAVGCLQLDNTLHTLGRLALP